MRETDPALKPRLRDRAPLTLRGLAALVLGAVIDLIVVFGVPVPSRLETALVGVVMAVALVYAVITGRRKVTPVTDPKMTLR